MWLEWYVVRGRRWSSRQAQVLAARGTTTAVRSEAEEVPDVGEMKSCAGCRRAGAVALDPVRGEPIESRTLVRESQSRRSSVETESKA